MHHQPLLASPLLLRSQPTRRVPTPHSHSQQLRTRILHRTGLINPIRRRDIIVRKRIAQAIQIRRMHDPRVVIRDGVLIILAGRGGGRDGVDEEGGAIERGAEAGDEGAEFDVGARDGEGARGAAEDVGGGGLGEGEAGAEVEEGGGGVDVAGDGAPGGLGVDGELLGGVLGPDLVDVGLVVVCEEGGVEGDAVVGAQGAEVAAGGVGDDEGRPACAVGGGLRSESVADGVEAVGGGAGDGLGCVGGVG